MHHGEAETGKTAFSFGISCIAFLVLVMTLTDYNRIIIIVYLCIFY